MPNLRGANPVGRDDGGPLYAARAGGKGESRVGDVDGVWRDGMIHSRTVWRVRAGHARAQGTLCPLLGDGSLVGHKS